MQTKTKLKLHYHEESIEGCIIKLTLSLLHLKHELVPITEANKELTRKVSISINHTSEYFDAHPFSQKCHQNTSLINGSF